MVDVLFLHANENGPTHFTQNIDYNVTLFDGRLEPIPWQNSSPFPTLWHKKTQHVIAFI